MIEDLKVSEQEMDEKGIALEKRGWKDIGIRELQILHLVANGGPAVGDPLTAGLGGAPQSFPRVH